MSVSDSPRSIFVRLGDRYTATAAALSPWGHDVLHGGPTTMLLARQLESIPADEPMFTARLTVELMRRIGPTPLEVRSRVLRPGRKVQLVEASLWSDDVEVARATALRIRLSNVVVPVTFEEPPHALPGEASPLPDGYRPGSAYHRLGVETRAPVPLGTERGPGWAWFRLRLPLLEGEKPSPLVRLCAAADFGSGISNVVDPAATTYINPDLTINIHREPVGEWICVDARTWLESHGVGVAESALYDERGRIGRTAQSLLVEPQQTDRG